MRFKNGTRKQTNKTKKICPRPMDLVFHLWLTTNSMFRRASLHNCKFSYNRVHTDGVSCRTCLSNDHNYT